MSTKGTSLGANVKALRGVEFKKGTSPSPFNDFSLPSGGVVLKSSDGVELKVYKNILALASPFFRQMFTLPQPSESNGDTSSRDTDINTTPDAQVIDVPESSSTLNILLRLIYPIAPPTFPGISESGRVIDAKALVDGIEPVLVAALKYDMQLVVKQLCSKLLDAAETTLPDGKVIDDTLALRIFVLACRNKLKDEARRAAHASLKGRVIGVFIKDLREISAAQYFHLIQFHQKVVAVVQSMLQTFGTPSLDVSRLACPHCSSNRNNSFKPASWWEEFVSRAGPIMQQSPKSDHVFSASFMGSVYDKAKTCQYGNSSCRQLSGTWGVISQEIKEKIDDAIYKNDINLSEV